MQATFCCLPRRLQWCPTTDRIRTIEGDTDMKVLIAALTILLALLSPLGWAAAPAGLWLESMTGSAEEPALLLATDVNITVTGLLADTALTQHFVNQTDQFAEGRYLFPLPDNSSVERLEIMIGERRIEGEIRERGQARQAYRQARDSGRAAGLVEHDLGNLFTTRVANIPPGERVEIRIAYRQRVDHAHGRFSLRFPTTVVPRFGHGPSNVHGMSDGSRRGASHFRSSPLSVGVDLRPGMPLASIEASHHEIWTEQRGQAWRVELRDEVVDSRRDFELEWVPADSASVEVGAFAERRGSHEHLLLMLTPPRSFEAVDTPREVVLIIDTSGSMRGQPMVQARESLLFALASLGPDDRFNVIEFNHHTRSLFDAPVDASSGNVFKAKQWVSRLNAGGGTIMGPSLAMSMRDPVPTGFLRQIVFVTDGLIANESQVLDQVRNDIGDSRLFTVGIGHGVNSEFLRQLSDIGRGSHTLIGELDQISRRMSELVMQLESPVLHDIELQWPGDAEMYPLRQRDLYVGEPLMVTARLERMHGDLVVSGTSAGQPWREVVPLEAFQPATGVAAHWASQRINALEGVRGRTVDPEMIDRAVLATALDYGLVSSRTSLVAVDRTPLRSRADALAAHDVSAGPAQGRDMQLRAMPATDAGSFNALVRAAVALLLIVLLFSKRSRDEEPS
jgi:Ca-activated chloride channel homolog